MKDLIKQEFFDRTTMHYYYFAGEMVAVVIPVKSDNKIEQIEHEGKKYSRMSRWIKPARTPYIEFATLRPGDITDFIDDDSPVTGGFDEKVARQLILELGEALWLMDKKDELMTMTDREVYE